MTLASRAWLITPQAPDEIWTGYRNIPPQDLIIAVDGGLKRCLDMNLNPHYLCGDLDSVDPDLYASFPIDRIWRYERDKDETDTELALAGCLELGLKTCFICNDLSGRFDHALGLIQNLLMANLRGLDCSIISENQRVFFIPDIWEIEAMQGNLLSLIAWQGEARFASSEGLRWKLDGLCLKPELSRGISNEIVSDNAIIRKQSGQVLAILTKRG